MGRWGVPDNIELIFQQVSFFHSVRHVLTHRLGQKELQKAPNEKELPVAIATRSISSKLGEIPHYTLSVPFYVVNG